jgi:hypothetical protein
LLQDIKVDEPVHTNPFQHLYAALKEMKQNKTLLYSSLSTVLGGGGLAAGELQTSVFSLIWPTWAVGLARGTQAVATIPGYYYAEKLIDKLGVVKVIILDLVTNIARNVLICML